MCRLQLVWFSVRCRVTLLGVHLWCVYLTEVRVNYHYIECNEVELMKCIYEPVRVMKPLLAIN